jgi:hypothetical protein
VIAIILVDTLLEAEEIDWSSDPNDPDSQVNELQSWTSIAAKHGFEYHSAGSRVRYFLDPRRTEYPWSVVVMGDYGNPYYDTVTIMVGTQYTRDDRFLLPLRLLDDFLGQLAKAYPKAVDSVYAEWQERGPDAKGLNSYMKVAAWSILDRMGVSYGQP